MLAAALAYLVADKFWISKHIAAPQPVASGASETASRASTRPANAPAFSPPPHTIAVLPFVNMSGDKEQEYFSEGLTEELLNSLSRIHELQVAARTSSFSFQGEHPDITTVAHKLNVGAVLEGSVRRSAHTVRISAQLVNGVTGFHLWSQTYDRDLGDVLKLQTEIANAVASALKLTLLGDVAAKIELGGSRNPAAFDAYLRGVSALNRHHNAADLRSAVAAFAEAIRMDPGYALAFAGRSTSLNTIAEEFETGALRRSDFDKALADARQAIALAPELGEAHLALARVLDEGFLEYTTADGEYASALELAPGSARVLEGYGRFAVNIGRIEPGFTAIRHAVALDPLNVSLRYRLGEAQWVARRYDQAVMTFTEIIALDPETLRAYGWRGFAYYGLGELQRAHSSCDAKADIEKAERGWDRLCLALVYNKLGRHAEAEAMLAKQTAVWGDMAAYQYSEVYAQSGEIAKALQWLEYALRVRDPGLGWLKGDPLLDPLRKEPRFQAIERELKFPD